MTVKTFRETHKDRAVILPLSEIWLTEHCHTKAVQRNEKVFELYNEPLCIVRRSGNPNENSAYNLVVGYRDYMTAKNNSAEYIKAIIVPDKSRRDFFKSLDSTFEMWNTSNVHEPKNWAYPKTEKVYNCQKNFEVTGTFGKAIIVSPNGTILDGYAAVCAAWLIGVDKIPVYVISPYRWNHNSQKIARNKFSKTS